MRISMLWYNIAVMLEKMNFGKMTCNHDEINFFFKDADNKINIIALVDATKRYYYESSAFSSLSFELERKFLLRGAKEVNTLFIVFTNNPAFYRDSLKELDFWLVDSNTNRLMIYEDQPDDFLDLKKDIELSLTTNHSVKIKKNYPFVTFTLLAINLIVFLFVNIVNAVRQDIFISYGANNWNSVFNDFEYYRLITSMFLHSDLSHLINNMMTLGVIGIQLENKLGHIKFFTIYMLSGIIAGLASALYYMNTSYDGGSLVYSIGASGAIFGIFGAFIVLLLMLKSVNGTEISIERVLIVTFLMLYSGFTNENIDNIAHLAGIISGSIITFIYCKCCKSILK